MKSAFINLPASSWMELLEISFREDQPSWDWTTALCDRRKTVTAVVKAKEPGLWCAEGLVWAVEVHAESRSLNLKIKSHLKDGQKFKANAKLVQWTGSAEAVLAYERSFLNLAAYSSGIATQTARLVDKLSRKKFKNKPQIVATRKILPAYRDIANYSVYCGGGSVHRLSLSSAVLIKENHLAVTDLKTQMKQAKNLPHLMGIELEVRNFKELNAALEFEIDAVMLDNFEPLKIKKALKIIQDNKPGLIVEVSGGVTEKNILSHAIEGVDVISSGSLTHSVRSIDMSLLIKGSAD